MHQQPRIPQRTASPAIGAGTGFAQSTAPSRPRSAVSLSADDGERRAGGNSVSTGEHTNDETTAQRLNMIMQNFFTKAAALIIHSRLKIQKFVQQADGPRYNRWFQLQTREFDDFREELRAWKGCGIDNLPPSLVIETYLDTSRLSKTQTLVAIDELGARWNVVEAIQAAATDAKVSSKSRPDVILERWTITLDAPDLEQGKQSIHAGECGPALPGIYKRCIVFFRVLFTLLNFGHVFEHCQRFQDRNHLLTPKIRVKAGSGSPIDPRKDPLQWPILGHSDGVVTEKRIGDINIPIGSISMDWITRNECDFRIEDNSVATSSHLIGMDDRFFKPSVPTPIAIRRALDQSESASLPPSPGMAPRRTTSPPPMQTYGSLNTFHGENAISTSPLTALKQVRAPGSDSSSYSRSHSTTPATENAVPHSLPVYGGKGPGPSRLNIRETHHRSPSISTPFSPFKAGSLAGSPRIPDVEPPSPSSVSRRTIKQNLAHVRNKSQTALSGLAQLRNPGAPSVPSSVESHAASSPKPSSMAKYSSSFPHRRSTLSTAGTPRYLDEDGSSGKQSVGSEMVVAPGSSIFAASSPNSYQDEAEAPGSSGLDLGDFLKMLDSKKNLKSFEAGAKVDGNTSRTMVQLSKYMGMRESNAVLSESMSASVMMSKSSMRRASGPSPGALMASSPGKPQSPHAPNVPSRLSNNSLVDGPNSVVPQVPTQKLGPIFRTSMSLNRDRIVSQSRPSAIDIPSSPRPGSYPRNPAAISGSLRVTGDEEEYDLPFSHDSMSSGGGVPVNEDGETFPTSLGPAADIQKIRAQAGSVPPRGSTASPFGRKRYTGMAGLNANRNAANTGSGSLSRHGSYSGAPARRSSRDKENEVFQLDLSESPIGRMSLEDGARPLSIPKVD